MSRADMNKEPNQVAAMFDGVAKRYDLVNDLLSLGQTKIWRRQTTAIIDPKPGLEILDLAAGTGASSIPLAKKGAKVTAADFSDGMLEEGRRRHPELHFVKADALKLPFQDKSFDVVTISFGLRNTVDYDTALREMLRVTRPGGRLVICEFSQPTILRSLYMNYLMKALPKIARWSSSNPEAYVYLAESIRAWPDQRELARHIEGSGWVKATWRNLTFGVVSVHSAIAPE